MSASNKKKLRKEQEAAVLTEKQLKEKAEAKKLKAYSITFTVIMALVLCIAIITIAYTTINKTGIFQKNIVAVTINDHELNSVDLGYYYVDAISKEYADWSSTYGENTVALLRMMGLDLTAPLSTQVYNPETNETWADYFIAQAIENARGTYALYDAAVAEGFVMSEEDRASLDENTKVFEDYAELFAGGDTDAYIEQIYGTGADLESYKAYVDVIGTANAYQTEYYNSLSYDDAAIRAHEADRYNDYTGYTFAYKFIDYNEFLHETTEEEHEHSDEEISAALAEAKAAAESLLSAKTVEEFDEMISALEIFAPAEGQEATVSTKSTDTLLTSILSAIREWISSDERKEGDTTVVPYSTDTTNEDGTASSTLMGYFAVYYQSKNENLRHLANVRHLLVEFEGGTKDESGNTVYTIDEKAAAKTEAESLLEQWKKGAATEESFIELVKEHSDDTSAETGGLFEDITPKSQYVPNFLSWSIDESRKAGDAEVIETEFGYHVMYYVGDSEMTYRDYLIHGDLKNADYDSWIAAKEEGVTAEVGNLKYMYHDYIVYTGY